VEYCNSYEESGTEFCVIGEKAQYVAVESNGLITVPISEIDKREAECKRERKKEPRCYSGHSSAPVTYLKRAMSEEPSEREILWRDYALSADLYKFYVETVVKVNVFYYAITGAIVSFCFAQRQIAYTKWALMLPALMSVSLAFLCGWSIPFATTLQKENYTLARKLGMDAPHEFGPLVFILWMFAALQTVSAIGLIVLLYML